MLSCKELGLDKEKFDLAPVHSQKFMFAFVQGMSKTGQSSTLQEIPF